jgi:hypothetical protein
MSHVLYVPEIHISPKIAAAPLLPYQPVVAAAGVKEGVAPAASAGHGPLLGVTLGASVASGLPVAVAKAGAEVKLVAGASLGAGCQVAVATTNGRVIPAASGSEAVGVAEYNAAAGEIFTALIQPRRVP